MRFEEPCGNQTFAPNRYYDPNFKCEAVKILPGEYYATSDETLIVTVLGSCVSVCLRDPLSNIGGMNHFLLPHDESTNISSVSESARYGVFAMELLINQMLKLGAQKKRKVMSAALGNILINSLASILSIYSYIVMGKIRRPYCRSSIAIIELNPNGDFFVIHF